MNERHPLNSASTRLIGCFVAANPEPAQHPQLKEEAATAQKAETSTTSMGGSMKKWAARTAAMAVAAAAVSMAGTGQAAAITAQWCEDEGGIAILEQNGTWTCIGGIGNGLQILDR
ncbi:hypothetical protein [Nocardia arizonensis]|uniref:hypothetical protein n=1 Tax=Nocardia arizonensis TaxID=1141647 RepID=UPI000AE4C42C|nr:hypothetical protein [Nocardia arizonensis]